MEIWQKGGVKTIAYASTSKIKSVVIDPIMISRDINNSNNSWTGASVSKPVPPGVSATDVISKYLQSVGGKEKVTGLTDVSITSSGEVQGQKIVRTQKVKYPDKYLMEIALPDMNMSALKILVNGDSVKLTQMGQSPALDDDTRRELKEGTQLFPELDFNKPGYKTELTAIKNLDGKDAYEMKVSLPSGGANTFYYDVNTGYKLKTTQVDKRGQSSTVEYSDYRDVSGLKFPYHVIIDQGEVVLDLTVQSVQGKCGSHGCRFQAGFLGIVQELLVDIIHYGSEAP